MEKPSPNKFSVAQLLQLRKTIPDLFYSIVIKLTNRQLNDLCLEDPENSFCEDKEFWENLWYRRNKTTPPIGTVGQIRQAYEEENLLESLVEEIRNDPTFSRILHERIYFNNSRTEGEYYWDMVKRGQQELYDKASEEDFQQNWNADKIREVLTRKDDPNDPDSNLTNDAILLRLAFETKNDELLRYLFLNIREDTNDILATFPLKDKEMNEMIDRVLQNLKPISRVPFIKMSKFRDIILFAARRSVCTPMSGEIVKAYFEVYPKEGYIEIKEALSYPPAFDRIKKCVSIRRELADKILSLSERQVGEIKEFPGTQNSLLIINLLDEDEVEPALIKHNQKPEIVQEILKVWKVDRSDLLRELMKEDNWQSFQQVLTAISNISGQENNSRNDRELYQLYLDFLADRERRRKKKIYIWNGDRGLIKHFDVGEDNMEMLFLESFKDDYLFKVLYKSIENGFPITYLDTPNTIDFITLTDEQRSKLQKLVEEVEPEISKRYHFFD